MWFRKLYKNLNQIIDILAVEDIKIRLTQYDWTGSVQTPDEASIFSDKNYTTNVAPFDLIDYLLDEDFTLRWSFENISDDFDSPKLLPFGSEITVKVSNYDGVVASFFKMNSGTTYIKWKCDVFYKNKLVHSGWITPEGVEYMESSGTSSDTHVLIIRIKDLITEIKDYFSNTPLKSNMDVNWADANSVGVRYLGFGRMLREQFPGVEFVLNSNMLNMKVMETPFFAVYNDNSWAWWKTGYERVYTNGENRWDWLRRLCNAMGFMIFSFVDDTDNKQKVAIKNRSDGGLTSLYLDPDLMIEFSKSKEHNNSLYDAVIINNGTMIGGDYPFYIAPDYDLVSEFKGGRLIIISEKYEPNYSCNYFNKVVKYHGGSSYRINFFWNNHKMQCIRSEDDNRITIYKAKGANKPERPLDITSINKDKILYIDTGSSYPEAMKIRLDTNSSNTGHTIGVTQSSPDDAHFELIYLGNYGEMLTGIEAGGGAQTYEDYILSGQFKANFNPFLSNMERFVYRYVHKEVITSPYYKVTGSNGQSILYGRFWDIASLEVDLINEITSFDLIGQKFTFSQ